MTRYGRRSRILATLLVLGGGTACDGGSSPPTAPGPNPYTITISASGVASPKPLTVPPGSRVLFINNDTRRHDMTSDPHPEHSDCEALNQVGLLNPGQRGESENLVTIRTCGFHDHDNPNDINLRGSILVR